MSSSVSGGSVNGATADFSSVSGGGAFNVASGVAASVSGGSKGRLPAITTRRWSPVRQGDGHKKTGRNIDRACGHLRGQDFKRRQTRADLPADSLLFLFLNLLKLKAALSLRESWTGISLPLILA